jgi:molybdopterin synthase catalytic subunit
MPFARAWGDAGKRVNYRDGAVSQRKSSDRVSNIAGARVVFAGLAGGRGIEFSAYHSMAEWGVKELVEEAARAYETPVLRIYAEHAVGRVEVGEMPVIIVVGASDGTKALESRVPIWGKESGGRS